MGHRELQRVAVRMVYDSAFTRAIHSDPDTALEGIQLRPEEKQWLLGVDPRAFGVDEFRCDRTLKVLLDEYPRSGCMLFRRDKNLRQIATFFSSTEFHGCIQERRSLSPAFGAFLKAYVEGGAAALVAIVSLEHSLTVLRRQRPSSPEQGAPFRLAANVALHSGSEGTMELFRELGDRLARTACDHVAALLNPGLDLRNLPAVSVHQKENLLLVVQDSESTGISLEVCPDGLYPVLSAARVGSTKEELLTLLRQEGAEPGEDQEVLQDLCDDGLLSHHENTPM